MRDGPHTNRHIIYACNVFYTIGSPGATRMREHICTQKNTHTHTHTHTHRQLNGLEFLRYQFLRNAVKMNAFILRGFCSTRRHVFLLNKKTSLLVEQEDMSSGSTRRHVLLVTQHVGYMLAFSTWAAMHPYQRLHFVTNGILMVVARRQLMTSDGPCDGGSPPIQHAWWLATNP